MARPPPTVGQSSNEERVDSSALFTKENGIRMQSIDNEIDNHAMRCPYIRVEFLRFEKQNSALGKVIFNTVVLWIDDKARCLAIRWNWMRPPQSHAASLREMQTIAAVQRVDVLSEPLFTGSWQSFCS